MRLLSVLALITVATGCQKQSAPGPTPAPAQPAPAPAPAQPTPSQPPAAPEAHDENRVTTMVDVMKMKLSPFVKGESTDEEAFRYALQQLREMAPPDSNYNSGNRPWFQIVDDMLTSKQYKRGCQECHRLYKKDFEHTYGDGQVVWVDPPKPAR